MKKWINPEFITKKNKNREKQEIIQKKNLFTKGEGRTKADSRKGKKEEGNKNTLTKQSGKTPKQKPLDWTGHYMGINWLACRS